MLNVLKRIENKLFLFNQILDQSNISNKLSMPIECKVQN